MTNETTTSEIVNARIIVPHGRSLTALAIAQSLGRRGAEIIGCDDVDMTVLSFSKYVTKNCVYTPVAKDEDQFIADMVKIARDNKPDDDRPYILMPAFNESKTISAHADQFEGIITLSCAPYDAIKAIHPKDNFARTTQKYDVASPQTWLPANDVDLGDVPDDAFPVFIKPPNDVGGRGISKINNRNELEAAYEKLRKDYPGQQIIIQQASTGTDYCFCGLFNHGEYVTGMVYINKQKFPNESGPGVVRETIKTEPFDRLATELMKPIGWHGVVEIDFLWNGNESTEPQMIEVNPRFWSGLDHSIRSNLDFPYLLYQLIVNGKVTDIDDVHIGHKTSLPGMSNLARIESLFSNAIRFEELEKQWPDIKSKLKLNDYGQAYDLFSKALKDSLPLSESIQTFRLMLEEAKQAQKISPANDDPFVGLGALFILASLIRHGKLPPEVRR